MLLLYVCLLVGSHAGCFHRPTDFTDTEIHNDHVRRREQINTEPSMLVTQKALSTENTPERLCSTRNTYESSGSNSPEKYSGRKLNPEKIIVIFPTNKRVRMKPSFAKVFCNKCETVQIYEMFEKASGYFRCMGVKVKNLPKTFLGTWNKSNTSGQLELVIIKNFDKIPATVEINQTVYDFWKIHKPSSKDTYFWYIDPKTDFVHGKLIRVEPTETGYDLEPKNYLIGKNFASEYDFLLGNYNSKTINCFCKC